MFKYSTNFKINAVQRYFNENISTRALAAELQMPDASVLRKWINLAQKQGLEALAVKHHKSHYDLDFKLKAVKYYQTHDVGASKVAAVFNIGSTQVNKYVHWFNHERISLKTKGLPPIAYWKQVLGN